MRAFSSWGEWELHFITVHGLLIAGSSLVVEHRLKDDQSSEIVACRL